MRKEFRPSPKARFLLPPHPSSKIFRPRTLVLALQHERQGVTVFSSPTKGISFSARVHCDARYILYIQPIHSPEGDDDRFTSRPRKWAWGFLCWQSCSTTKTGHSNSDPLAKEAGLRAARSRGRLVRCAFCQACAKRLDTSPCANHLILDNPPSPPIGNHHEGIGSC